MRDQAHICTMASSYNLRYKTSPDGRHSIEQEVYRERPKTITLQLEMGQEMSQNSIYQFLITLVKVEDIKQVIKKKQITEYLRIKSLFFYLHDVMKTVGGVKIP